MKHAQTTVAGWLTIAGATASFVAECLAHGIPGAAAWSALGTALVMGGGLIAAADGRNVPPKDAP